MTEASPVSRCCPVCQSSEQLVYLQKDSLRLVRCTACLMIYASPVAAGFVSGEYYDREVAGYYLSPAKLESDYAPVRFERELRLFRRYCQGGSVLDVGCSSGAFLFQLKSLFSSQYTVLGTDASGPALDYAESREIAVRRGDFLKLEFSEHFDAVTFWAVLEHVAEPAAFLQKAASLLKPGGHCFVLVPNMGSLAVRVLGGRYRYIYPQHVNYFTRETLRKLISAEPQFAVVDCRSSHFNPVVIWQDWRQRGAEVSNEQRAALLQRTTAYKQNPLLGPVRAGYRLLEKMLAAAMLADNLVMVLSKRR